MNKKKRIEKRRRKALKEYDPISYWNTRGKVRGAEWNLASLDNLVDWYLLYFGIDYIATALDIGCAWGRALRRFKQRNVAIDMTMCDISESHLELCKKEHNVDPDLWDGKTLPYDNESFDLVISNSILLHVPKETIQEVWDEQIRVSRKHLFVGTYYKGVGNIGPHCFSHDYEVLIENSNLKVVNEFLYGNHKVNWWLEKTV